MSQAIFNAYSGLEGCATEDDRATILAAQELQSGILHVALRVRHRHDYRIPDLFFAAIVPAGLGDYRPWRYYLAWAIKQVRAVTTRN